LVRKWVQRPSRRGEQFGQWLIKADPVPVSVGRPKITGVPGAGVNGTNGAFFRVVTYEGKKKNMRPQITAITDTDFFFFPIEP
jgi:hypothetical protein